MPRAEGMIAAAWPGGKERRTVTKKSPTRARNMRATATHVLRALDDLGYDNPEARFFRAAARAILDADDPEAEYATIMRESREAAARAANDDPEARVLRAAAAHILAEPAPAASTSYWHARAAQNSREIAARILASPDPAALYARWEREARATAEELLAEPARDDDGGDDDDDARFMREARAAAARFMR